MAHQSSGDSPGSVCARTDFVDTTGVNSTNFHLTAADKQGLFDRGAAAATSFLTTWDYEAWKRTYAVSVPA